MKFSRCWLLPWPAKKAVGQPSSLPLRARLRSGVKPSAPLPQPPRRTYQLWSPNAPLCRLLPHPREPHLPPFPQPKHHRMPQLWIRRFSPCQVRPETHTHNIDMCIICLHFVAFQNTALRLPAKQPTPRKPGSASEFAIPKAMLFSISLDAKCHVSASPPFSFFFLFSLQTFLTITIFR